MDKLGRPDWDQYFLTLAFVIAQRSFDTSTKCGCVIVSKTKKILSTGYNGPIKGSDDEKIPLTRPDKYYHMIHAEENAIITYSGSDQDIEGSTAYITSEPCTTCLRMMLQKGIMRLVYGDFGQAKMMDDSQTEAKEIMFEDRNIEIKTMSSEKISKLLVSTVDYIKNKSKEKNETHMH